MSFAPKKAVIEYSGNRLLRGALIHIFTYHVKLIIPSFFLKENPQQGHDLSGIVWKIEHKSWAMSICHCPAADLCGLREHS